MNRLKLKQCAFKTINPDTLYNPKINGYSHIAEVTNFSRIVHISGQGGEDIHGILSSTFKDQVEQTLLNLKLALNTVNCIFSDVAVFKILVVEHNNEKHEILIDQLCKIWPDLNFPTCTLIPVPCLAKPEMLIEIEATAYAV